MVGLRVLSRCDRYVRFAGGATLSLVTVAELLLILRVYALYLGNKYILLFLLLVLVAQIVFCAWGLHFGKRVPLPDGFPGCVLTGSSQWFATFWAVPLITDSCIFLLTLWRTVRMRNLTRDRTMQVILRDGIVYFTVIFSANLMNTLIYFLAPEDLKAVGARFEILSYFYLSPH
ncbi:hypothetical protein D9757_005094 [Collybiopsis confluens]|uniref:Uncharacterized protein n=1 Tax=Collybiopsis confluens TaxID=2823264 RepID=A0A8H5HSW9_9AGAR|nr:hypothetical protein D9757_005094 [Collybiopsis confluens]